MEMILNVKISLGILCFMTSPLLKYDYQSYQSYFVQCIVGVHSNNYIKMLTSKD